MTVKLHLHSGFDVPWLHIKPTTELGHLYSDIGDIGELHRAAEGLHMRRCWFQSDTTLPHYDLWGKPLKAALAFFDVSSDSHFFFDLERLGHRDRD